MSGDTAMDDIRPVVRTGGGSNIGMWAFMAVLLVGGFALFSALNARREALQAPATAFNPAPGDGRISAPPPLALPPGYEGLYDGRDAARLLRLPLEDTRRPAKAAPPATVPQAPAYVAPPPLPVQRTPAAEPWPPQPKGPQVVFDKAQANSPAAPGSDRVSAGRFANPALTVPQGTVIPAVMETALDSTRPGAARALIQRDIYSFDGSRVLVPRGSRLYGEYEADLARGQNRALIRWTRLIRPDGVTVALNSPASDPLGRAGVKGKVDGKFLQRFGGAILQSVLDLGVGVVTNKATDGVVVALPGSTQNLQITNQQQIQPTLKVRQGTSVSVFVARDLDFSSVEN